MSEIDDKGAQARTFFDALWRQGDYWRLETSPFEVAKYDRQLQLVADRRYQKALEIGCGSGTFTRLLAGLASRVTGLDVSQEAVTRAEAGGAVPGVSFRCVNVMQFDFRREGTWDLIIMSETIYYLGWLYPFFDITWLATELVASTTPGGRLLMANSYGNDLGDLLGPAAIRTYHDLFVHSGFACTREEVFSGQKDGVSIDCLISLFERPINA